MGVEEQMLSPEATDCVKYRDVKYGILLLELVWWISETPKAIKVTAITRLLTRNLIPEDTTPLITGYREIKHQLTCGPPPSWLPFKVPEGTEQASGREKQPFLLLKDHLLLSPLASFCWNQAPDVLTLKSGFNPIIPQRALGFLDNTAWYTQAEIPG